MRKELYTIFFLISILIIIYVICLCFKKKQRFYKKFLTILFIALGVNAVYCLYLLTNNEIVMKLSVLMSLTLIDWLIFFLVAFVNSFVGYERSKIFSSVLFILVVIDNVLLLTNIITNWVITLEITSRAGFGLYFIYHLHLLYIYHLIINYLMIMLILLLLIYKAVVSPSLYKIKYEMLLFIITAVVIVYNCLLVFDNSVDYSIWLYSLAAVLIYYFSINYTSKLLSNNVKDLVINGMADPILVYDTYGNPFYSNESVKKIFGIDSISLTKEDFMRKYPIFSNNPKYTVEFETIDKMYYIDLDCHIFKDKKNRIQAECYIFYDVTNQLEEMKQKEYNSNHDDLTKIYNRNYFLEEGNKILSNSFKQYYVLASNFRGFRLINDFFGGEKGNQILIETANILAEFSKEIPMLYARMGSDKFGILIEEKYDPLKVAKDFEGRVSKIMVNMPADLKIGICPVENGNVLNAYDKAVMTLHYLKKNLDQNICYYNSEVEQSNSRSHQLLLDMSKSIKNKDFVLFFQPQINEYDLSIIGAEALVRWNHPTLGRISPGEFIPLFEKHMVITELDLYVWEEACIFLKKYNDKNLSVSVNISAIDFFQVDVCSELKALIEKYEIDPKKLKLEITESAFATNQSMFISKVIELREAGFLVEMDDFGAGYSSFNALKDIPIDVLKLDMKFLDGDISNVKTIDILGSIIRMAHRIHLPIIVEGVETKEQIELLKSMNCDLIQGYYYAKPMPEDDFIKYIDDKIISNFLEFWTSSVENKELFSTFKEIQLCFNQSPISMMIVGPSYNDDNVIEDLIIYYCNPKFIEKSKLDPNKIYLQKVSKALPFWKNEYLEACQSILNNGNDIRTISTINNKRIHFHMYNLQKRYIAIVLTYIDE
ncbi:MAG: EAL domain-containing protein [Anaeroplasmataceae bacterium]